MLLLTIPGFREQFSIHYLVLDFNGTLAIDGKLIQGVKEMLIELSKKLQLHILTGNTFGTVKEELKNIPCKLIMLSSENQAHEKERYILQLNPSTVISIGNGRNDYLMLKVSAIGIIVIQTEGASSVTLIPLANIKQSKNGKSNIHMNKDFLSIQC